MKQRWDEQENGKKLCKTIISFVTDTRMTMFRFKVKQILNNEWKKAEQPMKTQ